MVCIVGSMSAHAKVEKWNLVHDYDMKRSDAGPAVEKALSAAKKYLSKHPDDEVVLYFPAGKWNVLHTGREAGIMIRDFSSGKLTLRGESTEKTTLVFSAFKGEGIYLHSSHNVTIEKMHLTRPHLYTTQGDLVSVNSDGSKIRIKIHPGFPDPVALSNKGNAHERALVPFGGDELNPITCELSEKIIISDVEKVGGRFYDFTIKRSYQRKARDLDAHTGQWIAFKSKVGKATIYGVSSNHTTFQDIRITHSSRDGIWMRNCNDQIARRIVIDRGDPIHGKLPFFSQPADGIHLWATTEDGGNLLVEDCEITGTADDGIAVIITVGGSEHFKTHVKNIVVRNNLVVMGLARSIIVNWSDGAQIYGNRIGSISMAGIRLENVINTEVRDNLIASNPAGHGIHLSNHAPFAEAGGNRFYKNTFYKVGQETALMRVDGGKNTQIENNVVKSFLEKKSRIENNTDVPAALVSISDSHSVSGNNYLTTDASMKLVTAENGSEVSVEWTLSPPPSGM